MKEEPSFTCRRSIDAPLTLADSGLRQIGIGMNLPPPQISNRLVGSSLEQLLQLGQVLQGILHLFFLQRRPEADQEFVDLSFLI